MTKSRKTAASILRTALRGLELIEKNNWTVDDFLDRKFTGNKVRRGPVADILFKYFRNKAVIDAVIDRFATRTKPRLKRLLAIGLTQGYFQDAAPPAAAANLAVDYAKNRFGNKMSGFCNAFFRNAFEIDLNEFTQSLPEEKRLNLPPLIWQRWRKSFGNDKTLEMAELIKSLPHFVFRSVGEIDSKTFEEAQCSKTNLPDWTEDFCFYQCGDPEALFMSELWRNGGIYIQDPAAVMAPSLVSPGKYSLILDLCAAPGGKSLALTTKVQASTLIAADSSLKRQELTVANFARIPASFERHPLVASASAPPFREACADLVVLDVPCSNTGVFRGRPDVLWNFTEKKLTELCAKQSSFLATAKSLVKSGGYILYSTCSVEKEENQGQIEAFLASEPDFELLKEQILLPSESHDGAYAALLRKR